MNGEQTMRLMAIIMSALSLGIGFYSLTKNAKNKTLIQFIALAMMGLLLIQICVLLCILSPR
jgi:heme A synthase